MLTAENPYKFKAALGITPSDRILSEIIHKAASLDPLQTEKILSSLVSKTCFHKNNCQKNENGSCDGIKCTNIK